MKHTDIRRFTRVNFDKAVRLDFGEKQYDQQRVSNISLGGMYVKGNFAQQPKDTCTIEAEHRWASGVSIKFLAKGLAVRCTDNGMAIEFVSMPHDSLEFLQTALLYQADDPLTISAEFGRAAAFELEESA